MLRPTTIILLSSLMLLTLLTGMILSIKDPAKNTIQFSPEEESSKEIYKFSPTQDKSPILLIISVIILGTVGLTILKTTKPL